MRRVKSRTASISTKIFDKSEPFVNEWFALALKGHMPSSA